MGQSWMLVNLENAQTLGRMGKLIECIWNSRRDLVELLYVPPMPPRPMRDERLIRPILPPRDFTLCSATFDDLLSAPHLVSLVFDYLDSYPDILRLALTSSDVWECGERRLKEAWATYHAPWRGAPIICIGDYAHDLPPNINDSVLLARLAAAVGQPDDIVRAWSQLHERDAVSSVGSESTEQRTVRYSQLTEKEEKHAWHRRLEPLLKALRRRPHLNTGESASRRYYYPEPCVDKYDKMLPQQVRSVLGASDWARPLHLDRAEPPFRMTAATAPRDVITHPVSSSALHQLNRGDGSAPGEPPELVEVTMVLRQLVDRQHVRSDTLGAKSTDPVWGFGRALMCLTCWTSDIYSKVESLAFDTWAGDSFDVISLTDFQKEAGEGLESWRDVTSLVRVRLERLWAEGDGPWGDEDGYF